MGPFASRPAMSICLPQLSKTTFIAAVAVLVGFMPALSQEEARKWIKKSHVIQGTWIIENDQIVLKGLSTKKAPDLKIFFSPLTVSELNNKNAIKGAKFVAKLKSPKGDQRYALPKEMDWSQYKSVIIHCERYSKLWGAAPLK